MSNIAVFLKLRDPLMADRDDLAAAAAGFAWPRFDHFNWALDYFDHISRNNVAPALRVVDDRGAHEAYSFAELSERSSRVANFLLRCGVRRADRVLLMLGNV